MLKKREIILLLSLLFSVLFALVLSSCVTTSTEQNTNKSIATGETPKTPQGKKNVEVTGSAETEYRLKQFLENGMSKIDNGQIADGLKQLVSVLAESEKLTNVDPETESVINEARTELTKLGASLSLEPGNEWLDSNMNQVKAKTIDLNKKGALQPSVIVTYNSATGKSIVASASILFQFVKGGGILTSIVNTNDYGQANCTIARFDNPNEENIIRAMLIVKAKGYTYKFENVIRDFVYVPPPRKATILVLEKSKFGVSSDPVILDTVYNKLQGISFDFSQYNGALSPDQFMLVFNGEPEAIEKLGVKKDVSYIVSVLNDCYLVSQLVFKGKKYQIYKSKTNATVRIIRVSDGKILYSLTVQNVSGQGNTEEKAVIDGYRKSATQIGKELEAQIDKIKGALLGSGDKNSR